MKGEVWRVKIPVLNTLGRYSLAIYMLHQPVLYMIVLMIQWFR